MAMAERNFCPGLGFLLSLFCWDCGEKASLAVCAEAVKSCFGCFTRANRPVMLVTLVETQWQVWQSCNSTKMDFGENMCQPDPASLLSAVGHGLATSTTMMSEWLSIMWPHLLATRRRCVGSSGLWMAAT